MPSIRVDNDGNIWSSAGNGVHCIASDGTLLGRIATPSGWEPLFRWHHSNRLFLCCWDAVYSVFVHARGIQHPALP